MALATQEDVEARLGRTVEGAEAARLPALLSDASATVIGYCRTDFEPSPYPEAVVGVTAKMIARVLGRSGGVDFASQQSAGPFSVSYATDTTTGDMWLTKADKMALRSHRVGGGLTSVPLVSDRYTIITDP